MSIKILSVSLVLYVMVLQAAFCDDNHRIKDAVSFRKLFSPDGDYTRLSFIIQTNKVKYRAGEPVFIRTIVRNDSDDKVSICSRASVAYFVANIISVSDWDGNEIPMTRRGEERLETEKKLGSAFVKFSNTSFTRLMPTACEFLETRVLNNYYDITLPGKSTIIFYRTTFMRGQRYEKPMKSNTVTFEIDSVNITPGELKGLNTNSFDNPSLEELAKANKDIKVETTKPH